MSRTDLMVPYGEKDEAKRLGARWDAETKVWYVPHGKPVDPFVKWLPGTAEIEIRCGKYLVAHTHTKCWKCGDTTKAFGIISPAGHETLEYDDDGGSWWTRRGEPCTVFYITNLLAPVAEQVAILSPNYRIDFSKTTSSSYLMNHCDKCGMKQGDFAMFCEPGGAFFPTTQEGWWAIKLQEVQEPFGCCGETSYGDHLFDMTRRPRNEWACPNPASVQQAMDIPTRDSKAVSAIKRWVRSLW